jgi:hypothetical protein
MGWGDPSCVASSSARQPLIYTTPKLRYTTPQEKKPWTVICTAMTASNHSSVKILYAPFLYPLTARCAQACTHGFATFRFLETLGGGDGGSGLAWGWLSKVICNSDTGRRQHIRLFISHAQYPLVENA